IRIVREIQDGRLRFAFRQQCHCASPRGLQLRRYSPEEPKQRLEMLRGCSDFEGALITLALWQMPEKIKEPAQLYYTNKYCQILWPLQNLERLEIVISSRLSRLEPWY